MYTNRGFSMRDFYDYFGRLGRFEFLHRVPADFTFDFSKQDIKIEKRSEVLLNFDYDPDLDFR